MSMANESINEVLVRSLNTTFSSLIPVVVLLFFGGETLKDFALALTIGLTVGRVLVDRRRRTALRDVEGARAEVRRAQEEVREGVLGAPRDSTRT